MRFLREMSQALKRIWRMHLNFRAYLQSDEYE
jgi:hypothetical protein